MRYLFKVVFNKFFILLFITGFSINSCSLLQSKNNKYKNVCHLLDDRISWYKSLRVIEEDYQVDMSLILAFIKQESSFKARARPPHKKLFNTIPVGRITSSYGYAQATTDTWQWYQNDTGNTRHRRDDFANSAEFIAWYVNKSSEMNNIPKTDVYNQYLAYHEGQGGFKNKSYTDKPWLLDIAKSVAQSANNYKISLASCRDTLDNTYEWNFF